MKPGEEAAELETPDSESEDYFVEISVEDTGIGIKEEDLPCLFQDFSQLEGVYTKSYQGIGLGLALARRFVEMHGGTIRAESPGPGKGSTFIFRIPTRAALPEDGLPLEESIRI